MITLLKLERLQLANDVNKRLLQLIALVCEHLDQARGRSRFTPSPPKFFRYCCDCRNWRTDVPVKIGIADFIAHGF